MSASPQFVIHAANEVHLLDQAETIFDFVWRFDLNAPGFAMVNVGTELSSQVLRSWMIALKQKLSDIAIGRRKQPFSYFAMSRFDQQVTTKFHRDGAPDSSLLMLGYEPSPVQSRLYMADYARAAADLGTTPDQFLVDYNPMFKQGEEKLLPYATELPQPLPGRSTIVLINNSSLPPSADNSNPLGVLHHAVIVSPDKAQRRVINSIMLSVGEPDHVSGQQQLEFASTDAIGVYSSNK